MEEIRQLEKRIRQVITRRKMILTLGGIVAILATGAALSLILAAVASLFIIPAPIKIALLAIVTGLLILAAYRYWWRPLRSEKDVIATAVEIEKNHENLKGRLVAALQFKDFDLSRTNFSSVLVDMTSQQAIELSSSINFNEIISGYPLWQKLRNAAGIAVLVVLINLLVPGLFSRALAVYSQPTKTITPAPGYNILVSPGSAERVKYTDIEIGGALLGTDFPEDLKIYYRFADGRWQSEKVDLEKARTFVRQDTALFNPGDSLPFAITLKQVRRSFDYYIEAGNQQSPTYAINVVERPRLTGLKVTLDFPPYTGMKQLVLDEEEGSFAALVGSRATIAVEANRDIAEGYLVINDSTRQKMDFKGNIGETSLNVKEDMRYYVRLIDSSGEENPDPIQYAIIAMPDEYPKIDVLFPGFDLNLNDNMLIPFKLHISDDFGFTSLSLKYQIVSGGRLLPENVAIINYPSSILTEGDVSFNWDLINFDLLPSDYILYYFEIADNDNISGPKVSHSRQYVARLPSIDEIVQEAEGAQDQQISRSEKILSDQKEVANKLDQLIEQMQINKNLEWKDRKELEKLVNKQEEAQDQLRQMSEEFKKSIEEAEKNNLMASQIAEKMKELQKLFNEIATEEMKDAIKRLQDALNNMSPEELAKAMKDFEVSQDEMLQRLERSIILLKKLQLEQKLSAMLKMAEEILMEQNRLNLDTQESLNANNKSALASRSQQLQKQMAALKKEAKELREMVNDSTIEFPEDFNDFANTITANTADSDMSAMETELNNQLKDAAVNSGQQASDKLDDMLATLKDIAAQLSINQGNYLAELFSRALNDAIYLSEEEEKLFDSTDSYGFDRDLLNQAAAEQQLVQEGVKGLELRLAKLGKLSPFLAAEIVSHLRQCQNSIIEAINQLSDGRSQPARDAQRDAMYNLNRSALLLLENMQQQSQCNNNKSCDNINPSLQSMCKKQGQINRETQGMCNKPGNKLSASEKQALQKLAGEQGALRKSMDQLQAEFGDRREILGRLDALADEMKEVEEMMEDGKAGDELIDRQLKIYSRMLDMQKSVSRRDRTRERKSTVGEDIWQASPGPLDQDQQQLQESLQEKLNRYMREGYPRQYEQQIKAYFKALTEMNRNRSTNE